MTREWKDDAMKFRMLASVCRARIYYVATQWSPALSIVHRSL
jgi:hypothetical protein